MLFIYHLDSECNATLKYIKSSFLYLLSIYNEHTVIITAYEVKIAPNPAKEYCQQCLAQPGERIDLSSSDLHPITQTRLLAV